MYEGTPGPRVRTEYRKRRSEPTVIRRPDRIALWAVAMAVIGMIAAAASAHAGGGGVSARGGGTDTSGRCPDQRFGVRALKLGDCGGDVKTLHWLLKASSYGVPMDKDFDGTTSHSVRSFQKRHHVGATGVVRERTRRKLVHTMSRSVATWYGPGLFGNRTACGKRLRRSTIGVAHRRLPCGTKVTLKYRGRYVRAKVIDRGPYANGARWDLTQRTAEKLHLTTTDKIRAAPIK
jgi:peptidoglycan hydrolase-like protein with peptidoglycan-binding domain